MDTACRYVVNSPAVASEIIDGEAVIMHLQSGLYFSTTGSGAVIWAVIESGATCCTAIAQQLAATYSLPFETALSAAESFLAELLAHELIRPAGPAAPLAVARFEEPQAYAPPRLSVYADMQDLLLLDPIHDVDPVGWPVAAGSRDGQTP